MIHRAYRLDVGGHSVPTAIPLPEEVFEPLQYLSLIHIYYLCPHDEKVRRRHIAFALAQLLHLLPARRVGG